MRHVFLLRFSAMSGPSYLTALCELALTCQPQGLRGCANPRQAEGEVSKRTGARTGACASQRHDRVREICGKGALLFLAGMQLELPDYVCEGNKPLLSTHFGLASPGNFHCSSCAVSSVCSADSGFTHRSPTNTL